MNVMFYHSDSSICVVMKQRLCRSFYLCFSIVHLDSMNYFPMLTRLEFHQ